MKRPKTSSKRFKIGDMVWYRLGPEVRYKGKIVSLHHKYWGYTVEVNGKEYGFDDDELEPVTRLEEVLL